MRWWRLPIGAAWLAGGLIAAEPSTRTKGENTMKLTSTAWADGRPIPAKYTCDGLDVSPPLTWSDVPAGTKSLALICDDPDAPVGTWVHWVVYALPATATALPEKTATTETLADGTKQGLNDFRRIGYGGPCPPPGAPHHYLFKLYALDTALALNARPRKADLVRAMEGHILAEARLVGTYQRAR